MTHENWSSRGQLAGVLDRLGLNVPNAIGFEVGVQRGLFAEQLLRSFQGTLWLVDAWRHLEGYNDPANVTDEEHELIRIEAFARCDKTAPRRWRFLRDLSVDAAKDLIEPPGSIYGRAAFVYLDADHSYEAVRQDIAAWLPLVQPGGVLAGHDWDAAGQPTGVQKAVKEAFPDRPIYITSETHGLANSWLVIK